MKISLNWIHEFVDIETKSPDTIGESLTIHTAELEKIIHTKPYFQNVVTGKLLSHESHPNSDTLSIAQFDCGSYGKKQIIFGQVHSVQKGKIYPIALDGARLKSGLEIKTTEIRGKKSEGMIADNQELGMKNERLLQFHPKTKLGEPFEKISAEFDDVLFDIDNKSLTHRPDLWGQEGFARELSAIWNKKFTPKNPNITFQSQGVSQKVMIKSPVCRRFCALKMSGVNVSPSPLDTQIRLENLDVRSISNIVDVTNLVLLELGQPMHVFDAAKVSGAIIVRQARQGETLLALDGETYELTPADTVVADEEKVLSLAGIMGGAFSGVSDQTTEIILECANWDPVAIRHTSTRLGLRSDSSIRYEKSLDPESCHRALFQAVEYIQNFSPHAIIDGPLTDEYPIRPSPLFIELDPHFVRAFSGLDISDTEIKQKLESVDFKVVEKKHFFRVEIPSYRATKDIAIAEDLVEEIIRLYGFENVSSRLPTLTITPPRVNHLRNLEWQTKDFFAAQGSTEVYNYSFVDDSDLDFTKQKEYVSLQNPLSSEHTKLRRTLISNMVKNIESEIRTHGNLSIFEIGKVYFPQETEIFPCEKVHFGVLDVRINGDENHLFFHEKGKLEQFFGFLGLSVTFAPIKPKDVPSYFHPAKCAQLSIKDQPIGYISVLHPNYTSVKNAVFVFAELDMELILAMTRQKKFHYQKLSSFPAVHRDISLILDAKILMKDIEQCMYETSFLLKSVELFDEFQDEKKLGKGIKNLAFHLVFRSSEKTLNDTIIEKHFQSIVDILNKKYRATLRLSFDERH
jgi:phenylalanyl-tRNA synthetase beta chain